MSCGSQLLSEVPSCIVNAATAYYTDISKALAKSIVDEGKKKIRVSFPESIHYTPRIVRKAVEEQLPPNFMWRKTLEYINRGYGDEDDRSDDTACLVLISKKSIKCPFSLTEYGQNYLSEVQELANKDGLRVSDVICVRRSTYSIYNQDKNAVFKDYALSKAKPHKDRVFQLTNWVDSFSFHLDISCY